MDSRCAFRRVLLHKKFLDKVSLMYLQFLFESMPLPFLTLLLPFTGALLCSLLLIYNRFAAKHFGRAVVLPKAAYKLPFLLILLTDAVLSCLVWSSVTGPSSPAYALTGRGWTSVLNGDAASGIQSVLSIDAFSAISAALMAFVALAAGLSALADKKNIITPRKITFFLLVCTGIQGLFYASGLFMMFFFMLMTQLGVTGLFSNFAVPRRRERDRLCYYISRVLLLVMFVSGVSILYNTYGTDGIASLASLVVPSGWVYTAFILMVTPMLYIFVKQSPYLPDASRDCFFGIRTQASLFVVFRIVFSIYGPMDGLQKVSLFFIMLGLAMVVLGFFLSCGVKDPCNFSNAMLMYLKGMILCAAGTAMNGMFGAERAALYGVSAMESTIFLWLIYLPISAVLSIITVYLKQDNGGAELWHSSGLFARAPFIAFMLALVIAMLGGLPPFIGYSGRQLLFRSVTFISPFIMVMLFLFTMLMLLTGLRFLVSLMTEGRSSAAGYQYSGETTVSFPLMVLLVLFCAASLFPGALFESSVAPSVEALVNRTAPAAALHGGASK